MLCAVLGELVQTTAGKWITHPPTRCPNGHNLGAGEVLVGHQACLGHGGGHTTWTCRTCDQTLYGPPLNIHCTTLDGPATVRISSSAAAEVLECTAAKWIHATPAQPTLFRGGKIFTIQPFSRKCPIGHALDIPFENWTRSQEV